MNLNSVAEIDRRRSASVYSTESTVFEQGLGLFGSPDDAALLDEVVEMVYEEPRRPGESSGLLR